MLTFPDAAQRAQAAARRRGGQSDKAPMLVQATEIHYDYTNKRVSAVGNVQIYYAGTHASRPTRSSTTKRPSGCTPKATSG